MGHRSARAGMRYAYWYSTLQPFGPESGGSAPDPATSHSAPPVTYVLTTRRSVGAFFLRRWVHLWPEGIKLTVNANQGTPDQETKSSLGLLHRKTPLAEPLVSVQPERTARVPWNDRPRDRVRCSTGDAHTVRHTRTTCNSHTSPDKFSLH